MEEKVIRQTVEVLTRHPSDTYTAEEVLEKIVNASPELQYVPDNYLHKVYWPEFLGDQIGFGVEEGYLLYKYSIGQFHKYVVTRDLTSCVVIHLEAYYTSYTEAYNKIPLLKEKLERIGVYNGSSK